MNRQIRRRYILAILCPAALVMFAAAMLVSGTEKTEPPHTISPVEIASLEEPSVPVPQPLFTVGSWQGRVAVFEGQNPTPMMVLETPIASLPEADQGALAAGIAVYDRQILASMLEDYGS